MSRFANYFLITTLIFGGLPLQVFAAKKDTVDYLKKKYDELIDKETDIGNIGALNICLRLIEQNSFDQTLDVIKQLNEATNIQTQKKVEATNIQTQKKVMEVYGKLLGSFAIEDKAKSKVAAQAIKFAEKIDYKNNDDKSLHSSLLQLYANIVLSGWRLEKDDEKNDLIMSAISIEKTLIQSDDMDIQKAALNLANKIVANIYFLKIKMKETPLENIFKQTEKFKNSTNDQILAGVASLFAELVPQLNRYFRENKADNFYGDMITFIKKHSNSADSNLLINIGELAKVLVWNKKKIAEVVKIAQQWSFDEKVAMNWGWLYKALAENAANFPEGVNKNEFFKSMNEFLKDIDAGEKERFEVLQEWYKSMALMDDEKNWKEGLKWFVADAGVKGKGLAIKKAIDTLGELGEKGIKTKQETLVNELVENLLKKVTDKNDKQNLVAAFAQLFEKMDDHDNILKWLTTFWNDLSKDLDEKGKEEFLQKIAGRIRALKGDTDELKKFVATKWPTKGEDPFAGEKVSVDLSKPVSDLVTSLKAFTDTLGAIATTIGSVGGALSK
ncbi:MAG: hypothetical protein V1855_04405 [bacterium]